MRASGDARMRGESAALDAGVRGAPGSPAELARESADPELLEEDRALAALRDSGGIRGRGAFPGTLRLRREKARQLLGPLRGPGAGPEALLRGLEGGPGIPPGGEGPLQPLLR